MPDRAYSLAEASADKVAVPRALRASGRGANIGGMKTRLLMPVLLVVAAACAATPRPMSRAAVPRYVLSTSQELQALERELRNHQRWMANRVAAAARLWTTEEVDAALEELLRTDRLLKSASPAHLR